MVKSSKEKKNTLYAQCCQAGNEAMPKKRLAVGRKIFDGQDGAG